MRDTLAGTLRGVVRTSLNRGKKIRITFKRDFGWIGPTTLQEEWAEVQGGLWHLTQPDHESVPYLHRMRR